MTRTSYIYLVGTVLSLPFFCDCFATTEYLVLIADPLKTTRFHDTITKAAVCKAQFDWLARNTNTNGLQSPNPLAYQSCPYPSWGVRLRRPFLLAQLALQEFALNSYKPDLDADTKSDLRYHFDSDFFIDQTNARLITARQTILSSFQTATPDYSNLRAAISSSFHTVQDFYSHTNWIEMNKMTPNAHIALDSDLGIQVAPPNMPTCSDCSRDLLTPEQMRQANDWANSLSNDIFELLGWSYDPSNVFICKNNILNTGYLTSGYFFSEEAVAPKIASQMKCSHGGGSDSSVHIAATGGINKDTNTFLYSPHYDLHFAASDMAVQATINYLDGIRTAVNDEKKFGRLLGMIL